MIRPLLFLMLSISTIEGVFAAASSIPGPSSSYGDSFDPAAPGPSSMPKQSKKATFGSDVKLEDGMEYEIQPHGRPPKKRKPSRKTPRADRADERFTASGDVSHDSADGALERAQERAGHWDKGGDNSADGVGVPPQRFNPGRYGREHYPEKRLDNKGLYDNPDYAAVLGHYPKPGR